MRRFFMGVGAIVLAVPVHADEPPVPLPPHHPPGFYKSLNEFMPGPYVIFFDEGDATPSEGAVEILDNSVMRWPDGVAPHFILCYDPQAEGYEGQLLSDARMEAVTAELLKRGAAQVFKSTWDCYHREAALPSDRARMAILGVLPMPLAEPDTDNR